MCIQLSKIWSHPVVFQCSPLRFHDFERCNTIFVVGDKSGNATSAFPRSKSVCYCTKQFNQKIDNVLKRRYIDCHNQYRNNLDRNKDREQKEWTKLSHLTMPSQELTPSSGSQRCMEYVLACTNHGQYEHKCCL
jgi:hypothetical protein